MNDINRLIGAMIDYYRGDARRIQHFIKVHSFARFIGEEEGLDAQTLLVLETAAVVHDIGIKEAEAKYGKSDGRLQELEGPPLARKMLSRLGCGPEVTERVCYLVGHHHTYTGVDGPDYRILLEADALVNIYEDGLSREAAETAYSRVFATAAGKRLCATMFALDRGQDAL